jgi:electron transfer flavoprotein alpha/beta subunit
VKIICCVKTVGDFDLGSGHQWEIADNTVDLTYYPKQLNLSDASCFELALRCKLQSPEDVALTAVTVSDGSDLRFLKPLFALGADRCVCIPCKDDIRFAPDAVSSRLSGFLRSESPDWILFGASQSIGQNGATGILTAEKLGLTCRTGVVDFHADGGGMAVTSLVDEALVTVAVHAPAVLVLDESVTTLLRAPTLKMKLACASMSAETAETGAAGNSQLDPRLAELYEERHENHCEMLAPDEFSAMALRLFKGGDGI